MMLHNLWKASPLSSPTASQLIPLVRYASSQVGIKMDNLDVPSNLSLAPQNPIPAPRLIKKASEGSRIIPARLRPEFNVSLVIYDDIGRPIVNTLSFKDESVVNSLALDPSVFNAPLRKDILHRVVRWQLACRRSGNHKAKSRSETRGSTRKVRPQKGGGQARVGDLRYCLSEFFLIVNSFYFTALRNGVEDTACMDLLSVIIHTHYKRKVLYMYCVKATIMTD